MKYVDNYILAILLGLECGRVISYRDEDFEDVHPDRRLERDFVKMLQGLVNNSLMTNDGDFPLRFHTGYETAILNNEIDGSITIDIIRKPRKIDIKTFFKEYVEAISSDAITSDWVKTITWESRVKRFLKCIDKEQLLSDYSIDESYIKHIPVILYGYVKGLVEPKNFVSVLNQIPFTYEEEDSCEPAVKPITEEDDESQYVRVSAKMDLVKLVEELKLLKKGKSRKQELPKPDVKGFSKKQLAFTKEIISDWYHKDKSEYPFKLIRKKLGSNRHGLLTNENKLVKNNVSDLNVLFRNNFKTDLLELRLDGSQYDLAREINDNLDEIMFRLGIEQD